MHLHFSVSDDVPITESQTHLILLFMIILSYLMFLLLFVVIFKIDDSKNTHVYVSGLPPTITDDEFLTLMSKCGVIMNEPFTNVPRLKLYKDQNGKPKGDGRCCYIKVNLITPSSVWSTE
ncbi:unnamed protein product [Trichobilharzia regenti]|nr:unnamed protein product [Trichobilharzia regenti]